MYPERGGIGLSELIVNGKTSIEGKLTVNRSLVESGGAASIIVTGVLATDSYIEEIEEIETDRIRVEEVTVTDESFGSEDKTIVYTFKADELTILS